MRRFILLSSKLMAVFGLIVGSDVFLARLQPPPDYLASLHFADCTLPCWIGIDPGKTTFEIAYQRLASVFGNDPIYEATFQNDKPSSMIWMTLQSRDEPSNHIFVMLRGRLDGVIEAISFYFVQKINMGVHAADMQSPVAMVSSGKLTSLLGPPSRMIVPNPMVTMLDYFVMAYGDDQRGGLLYALDANRDSPVMALELYADGKMPFGSTPRFKKWGGFVSVRRYLQVMGRYPW